MDCRDIVEEYTLEGFLPAPLPRWVPMRKEAYRWLRKRFIKARTKALRAATAITTVSEWHRDLLQQLHPKQRVVCIPNGYDERLFVASLETAPQLPLRIVYTCLLYTSKGWPVYSMNIEMYGEEKPQPYSGEKRSTSETPHRIAYGFFQSNQQFGAGQYGFGHFYLDDPEKTECDLTFGNDEGVYAGAACDGIIYACLLYTSRWV